MVDNERIYAEKVNGTDGIIIVDPNGVIKDGVVEHRYIKSEDLVIYVSVTAQMNSKTLIYNNESNDEGGGNDTKTVMWRLVSFIVLQKVMSETLRIKRLITPQLGLICITRAVLTIPKVLVSRV